MQNTDTLSAILEVIYETATALQQAGVMDQVTNEAAPPCPDYELAQRSLQWQ